MPEAECTPPQRGRSRLAGRRAAGGRAAGKWAVGRQAGLPGRRRRPSRARHTSLGDATLLPLQRLHRNRNAGARCVVAVMRGHPSTACRRCLPPRRPFLRHLLGASRYHSRPRSTIDDASFGVSNILGQLKLKLAGGRRPQCAWGFQAGFLQVSQTHPWLTPRPRPHQQPHFNARFASECLAGAGWT